MKHCHFRNNDTVCNNTYSSVVGLYSVLILKIILHSRGREVVIPLTKQSLRNRKEIPVETLIRTQILSVNMYQTKAFQRHKLNVNLKQTTTTKHWIIQLLVTVRLIGQKERMTSSTVETLR